MVSSPMSRSITTANAPKTADGKGYNVVLSIVGYGWQLSIPYIQRLNKTGSQNLYATNSYFTSSIDGELINQATSFNATTTPSITDTLPVTLHQSSTLVTSDSFSYTVPAGGSNKLFLVVGEMGADVRSTLSATLNGSALTCQSVSGPLIRAYPFLCYVASPLSGTFSMHWTGSSGFQYAVYTVQNAAQSSPVDASAINDLTSPGSSLSTSVTTTQGSDLLIDNGIGSGTGITYTFGTNQTQTYLGTDNDAAGYGSGSYKNAASTAGTETMTRNFSPNNSNDDLVVVAIRGATTTYVPKVDSGSANSYSFSGNTWTIYDKNGTRYLFGSDDSGRLATPAGRRAESSENLIPMNSVFLRAISAVSMTFAEGWSILGLRKALRA